jgi:hypothetical protein
MSNGPRTWKDFGSKSRTWGLHITKLPMPRGTISWRDVYRMYDEKQIDAEKAATMMQEIRVKEWQEFEEKLNGSVKN